jgi:hypothetical protein
MKFRIVFWDVLPCKMIVDRRVLSLNGALIFVTFNTVNKMFGLM